MNTIFRAIGNSGRACSFSVMLFSVIFSGCEASDVVTDKNVQSSAITEGSWYRPSVRDDWHWQLTGTVSSTHSVDMYDIDLFDSTVGFIDTLHTQGKKVICYFSAGTYENWRSDAGSFPASAIGNALEDWAGEQWLDIRNEQVRTIMKSRLDLAVTKGCDGVEPDNVDGFQNDPGFPLTAANQLDYNRFLANQAHSRNLSVGLKNDLDQISALVDYFDFAVNEECFEYDECHLLTPFVTADKPVFQVEYVDSSVQLANRASQVCSQANNLSFSSYILPWDLDGSFSYSCLADL